MNDVLSGEQVPQGLKPRMFRGLQRHGWKPCPAQHHV
jgi:hypothetical protein